MERQQIKEIVQTSFNSVFSDWSKQIEAELYPDAFADPHSWLRVKASLKKNNKFLEQALTQTLVNLLCDQ